MKDRDNGLILVIDDCPLTLQTVNELLTEYGHNALACTNADDAMDLLSKNNIDVVLTDIIMPGTSGIELLEDIRMFNPDIPVILMTGCADLGIAVDSIHRGAFDFIMKPFDADYLIKTVRKAEEHVWLRNKQNKYREELEDKVQDRTKELMFTLKQVEYLNIEVIQRLTRMAEYRDTDTGDHISRIGLYSKQLAKALNMPGYFLEMIAIASSMHDIGKIGIPDSILLKPGPLTSEEFQKMKTHTTIGKKILEGSSQKTIQMAEIIAWTHHERWDGSGYPRGLKDNGIPVEGMIVMISDQYDALRSRRPYKQAFNHDEAYRIITEGGGSTRPEHFSPVVMKAFIEIAPSFNEIFNNSKDHLYDMGCASDAGHTPGSLSIKPEDKE